MKNIAVADELDKELWRRKNYFREKYDITIHGTRITQALAKLLETDIIFPLTEEGLLSILEIKKNKKVISLEVTFKMIIPVTKNYKSKKIVLSQD